MTGDDRRGMGAPGAGTDSVPPPASQGGPAERDRCDLCGAGALVWRRCQCICTHCHAILMTCSDL